MLIFMASWLYAEHMCVVKQYNRIDEFCVSYVQTLKPNTFMMCLNVLMCLWSFVLGSYVGTDVTSCGKLGFVGSSLHILSGLPQMLKLKAIHKDFHYPAVSSPYIVRLLGEHGFGREQWKSGMRDEEHYFFANSFWRRQCSRVPKGVTGDTLLGCCGDPIRFRLSAWSKDFFSQATGVHSALRGLTIMLYTNLRFTLTSPKFPLSELSQISLALAACREMRQIVKRMFSEYVRCLLGQVFFMLTHARVTADSITVSLTFTSFGCTRNIVCVRSRNSDTNGFRSDVVPFWQVVVQCDSVQLLCFHFPRTAESLLYFSSKYASV